MPMQGVKLESFPSLPNLQGIGTLQSWLVFGISVILVSLPVFVQAPLVRYWPWLSLVGTLGWFLWSRWWLERPATRVWGDLLFGFGLAWFAGSIYWGWLRWEPLLHLPIEAIALPLIVWVRTAPWGKVGMGFYLGALLGTVITDVYFYIVDLIPYWRTLLQVDQTEALDVLQAALAQVQTPWGQVWAIVLVLGLCFIGMGPLSPIAAGSGRPHTLPWWAFSGAVLGTLLVDGLFLLVASQF